jgi:hypothetical protein
MYFMASAVVEIQDCFLINRSPELITRSTSLLIDDTSKNVEIALNNYVRALLFHPKDPDR